VYFISPKLKTLLWSRMGKIYLIGFIICAYRYHVEVQAVISQFTQYEKIHLSTLGD